MFKEIWKTTKKAVLILGVLLSFFAVIEIIRAYQVLYGLHPVVGIAFIAVVLCGLGWLIARYVRAVISGQKKLVPPDTKAGSEYLRYVLRVLNALSLNEILSDEERKEFVKQKTELKNISNQPSSTAQQLAEDIEESVIYPALRKLDDKANKEVERSVRDIAISVAISPWRSVDLLLVLYRNIGMVTRIAKIYRSRVSLSDNIHILSDILSVVATVNILNFGGRFVQNFASSTPVVGRWIDDAAQGMGAGLFTSIAGHTAVKRCNIYKIYDEAEVQQTVTGKVGDYLADLKGIVWDAVKIQVPPDTADKMKDNFSRAIDNTSTAVDLIIRQPAVSVGRGVATTGSKIKSGLLIASGKTKEVAVAGGKHVVHGSIVGAKAIKNGAVKGSSVCVHGVLRASDVVKKTSAALRNKDDARVG